MITFPESRPKPVCATCGKPSGTWAVERDQWRVCPPCYQEYLAANPWLKLDPEQAHGLIDGGVSITCATCREPIRPGGPIRVFVNESTGEIVRAFCGICVRNYIARRRIEAIKSEILSGCRRGRSKGWLTKELVAEGCWLSDVRQAFEELLDGGELVQVKGYVRRPSAKERQKAAQPALF